MRYRRADLTWLALLALSAGLSVDSVVPFDVGWLPLLMVGLAYPAGRGLSSLAPAVWVFSAVAGGGLVLALLRSADPLEDWLGLVLIEFLASVLPWWAGRYRRLDVEQRAREHRIVAAQARLRERARIAQDMHDSLGHELALIALHGGALELATGLTDEQRRTSAAVREHAVRATERLHDIVRVLGGSSAAADGQPAGESVGALVRRAETAGLRVELRDDGAAPAWPPMVSQAAHRVVQESLTNAARHAPGATVTVTMSRSGPATRIEVVNDAATGPGSGGGTGQGLIGLDERVRLAGGRFEAGPRPGGGWKVHALLPDAPATTGPRQEERHDQEERRKQEDRPGQREQRKQQQQIGQKEQRKQQQQIGQREQREQIGQKEQRKQQEQIGQREQREQIGQRERREQEEQYSAARPWPDEHGLAIAVSRRRTRRQLLQTAALPLGVVLALVAALLVSQVRMVSRMGLGDDRFLALRVGQREAQVRPLLPPAQVRQPFHVIEEPPRPVGASCEYYHAGDSVTDLDPGLYRVCFAAGLLVAKDRLERA